MNEMNDREALKTLASQLLDGSLSDQEFLAAVRAVPVADLGMAQLDLDRGRRCGYPEVIFGQNKTPADLQHIVQRLADEGIDVLVTRVNDQQAAVLLAAFPHGRYNTLARTFRLPLESPTETPAGQGRGEPAAGRVAIVTAGTGDLPVAEEARETAQWMGADVRLIQDVGVAGPHRLPRHLDKLRDCDAVVVVAGMEGALPSVVGGYLACPVIAVPTSVGYGANFAGVSALLAMLNSCAANVAVVNIDAGFKGGYLAGLIAGRAAAARRGDSPR